MLKDRPYRYVSAIVPLTSLLVLHAYGPWVYSFTQLVCYPHGTYTAKVLCSTKRSKRRARPYQSGLGALANQIVPFPCLRAIYDTFNAIAMVAANPVSLTVCNYRFVSATVSHNYSDIQLEATNSGTLKEKQRERLCGVHTA